MPDLNPDDTTAPTPDETPTGPVVDRDELVPLDPEREAPSLASNDVTYDASAITVLEGLEAVRKRPGMYIGSTGPRGLHHLVYEVVDNSIDEAMAGHATRVDVTLQADGGVRVVDDGRGIPTDLMPGENRPAVEVVLTVLHAGGKFGGGGYAVSGGLHGVGISVVNALSHRLDVAVAQRGHVFRQSYADGVPQAPLEQGEETDRTGTTVTFWANPEIFETVEYDFETLRARFQQMAFLNKGLTITFTDERLGHGEDEDGDPTEVGDAGEAGGPHRIEYRYENGLVDYVHYLNSAKRTELVHPEVIAFESEDRNRMLSLEIAMQWTGAYSDSVHTYANAINTHEGGTHEEGFRAALTGLINRYAREKGHLKERDDNLSGEDIREGLTAVVSIKLGEPQFEGQTKTKLGNTEAKGFVQRVVTDGLGDWLERHPNEAREIIRKSVQAAAARVAARKARDATRRKGLLESSSLPGKLSDCQSNDPARCEIFIVEGDSAGGSAKGGRDPMTQAILPIRGKILNVEKARIDRVMANTEVQALISAFGSGIGEDFDENKLRYHKIVLMADADVDGQHIRTLLLTLLFRFMRPLIDGGFVYLAQPPLYRLKWSQGEHDFVYSDRERDAVMAAGLAAGRKLPKDNGVQRYKGLGEMNAKELWETTMDPDQRVLLQVTMENAVEAERTFSELMGEDVEPRRAFIQRNAKDVRFLDI
ncbi:DNA topoisomerase (ATP-hydrolyzing) subunit B [Angustibacter aerolatus]